MQVGAERSLRALVWLGLAAVTIAVVGVVYLHPNLSVPAPSPSLVPSASPTRLWPVAVSFADAEHGVVVFDRQQPGQMIGRPTMTMLLTHDGGHMWRPLPAGVFPFLGLWYADSSLLVVDGGQAVGTSSSPATEFSDDEGRTWRPVQLPPPVLPSGFGVTRTMTFADARNGWLVARIFAPTSADPSGTTAMWRTTDGGTTWSPLRATGTLDSARVLAMRFVDARRGVVAIERPVGVPLLLATEDSGESWQQAAALDVPGSAPLTASITSEGTRVLAVLSVITGAEPTASAQPDTEPAISARVQVYTAASDDAGRTWSAARPGPTVAEPEGQYAAPVVATVDWLAALDNARLWTSTDGGTAWTVRAAKFPKGLVPLATVSGGQSAMFVLSTPTGPAGKPLSGVPPVLLRSVDGGADWKPVELPQHAGR